MKHIYESVLSVIVKQIQKENKLVNLYLMLFFGLGPKIYTFATITKLGCMFGTIVYLTQKKD